MATAMGSAPVAGAAALLPARLASPPVEMLLLKSKREYASCFQVCILPMGNGFVDLLNELLVFVIKAASWVWPQWLPAHDRIEPGVNLHHYLLKFLFTTGINAGQTVAGMFLVFPPVSAACLISRIFCLFPSVLYHQQAIIHFAIIGPVILQFLIS